MSLNQRLQKDCQEYLDIFDGYRKKIKEKENSLLTDSKKIVAGFKKDFERINNDNQKPLEQLQEKIKSNKCIMQKKRIVSHRSKLAFDCISKYFFGIMLFLILPFLIFSFGFWGGGIFFTITFFLIILFSQGINDGNNRYEKEIDKIKRKINSLEEAVGRCSKNKQKMIEDLIKKHTEIYLNNAISNLSKSVIHFQDRLQEKYEMITSKYYIKDFGEYKIKMDIKKFINGKFPETLWTSDDFRKQFTLLFEELSLDQPSMDDIKITMLFN